MRLAWAVTMPSLVRVEGVKVVIGSRGFPLERVEDVYAEERRPQTWRWLLMLGLAVLAIPVLNGMHLASEQYVAVPYVLVAMVLFGAIVRVVFGNVTYALVLDVSGIRQVALKSSNHQLIISVMADVQDILQTRAGRS
jgi:hypothetical protein